METSETIAVRKLRLTEDEQEHMVTVRLFRPEPTEDDQNYACRFEIDGIQATSVTAAMGVDAVQAISLAFAIIGAALYTSQEYLDGRLRWLDDSGDLGFPQP